MQSLLKEGYRNQVNQIVAESDSEMKDITFENSVLVECARSGGKGKQKKASVESNSMGGIDMYRGPLGGSTFVVSGVFENITREKLEEFIKKKGGRLVAAVTRNTDYLIIGKLLDDNRPATEGGKYKKAHTLGKKIMTEKEFEFFCKQKFNNPDFLLGR